jgi:anti-sigma B factor antagonist
VAVRGEVDLVTAPAVGRCLNDALDTQPAGGRILLDLSGVSFFAAAGVRVLDATRARAERQQVELVLVATSPAVALILSIFAPSTKTPEVR